MDTRQNVDEAAAALVDDFQLRARAVDAARSRIEAFLKDHGPSNIDSVLDQVAEDLGESVVKQAFWQLVSDGVVDLDATNTLRLLDSSLAAV
jgi:hypothetical protein